MCRENVSCVNGLGFVLLIVASLACALSFAAPFWVYYPTQHGLPEFNDKVKPTYRFERASWRGLWAVCFKVTNERQSASGQMPECRWFWENDAAAWTTLPDWYLASEGLFAAALGLLLLALLVESLFACCHCCLRRSCAPTLVASMTVVAALLVVTSLALYGGFSFKEQELIPEPNGHGGRLDWAFYVGIGGAAAAIVAAILFYVDGCRLARIYNHYKKPPTVT